MATAITVSALLGYLLGALSPAALLDKLKHANLRKKGTRNLGATNTALVLGKKWGIAVMVFDILKAFLAVHLAGWIFPLFSVVRPIAGTAAVLGHVLPFYLRFKGGKGLAAFGGMVLALDPLMFLLLLGIAIVLMLIFNYGVCTPISAGILFPILYGFKYYDLWGTVVVAVAGIVIVVKNAAGIGRVRRGEEMGARTGLKRFFAGKFRAE